MDATIRMEALRVAKGLVCAHGIMTHMSKHNRATLAQDVKPDTIGLRYDFQLDPNQNQWAAGNPSCSLSIMYTSDSAGSYINEAGFMVIDNVLRITVSTSSNDMSLSVLRRREGMIAMLEMLGEVLTAALPPRITLTLQTPAEIEDSARRTSEQVVSAQIFANLGAEAFKGMRCNGSARVHRLTEGYASHDGKFPEPGQYRFRHVRSTDRKGYPKEIAYYLLRVLPASENVPPLVSIRRVEEFKK